MKVIVLLLSLMTAVPAMAKGDHDFTSDGTTEGNVPECMTGNCPQKQSRPLWTQDRQGDLATVNSIVNEGGAPSLPSTSKGTK
jgi:hypothetical protein